MADLRAITITWDPEATDVIDVAPGPGVSIAEAHHVLVAAADAAEYLCPTVRFTRGGVDLAPPAAEVFDQDEE